MRTRRAQRIRIKARRARKGREDRQLIHRASLMSGGREAPPRKTPAERAGA